MAYVGIKLIRNALPQQGKVRPKHVMLPRKKDLRIDTNAMNRKITNEHILNQFL